MDLHIRQTEHYLPDKVVTIKDLEEQFNEYLCPANPKLVGSPMNF